MVMVSFTVHSSTPRPHKSKFEDYIIVQSFTIASSGVLIKVVIRLKRKSINGRITSILKQKLRGLGGQENHVTLVAGYADSTAKDEDTNVCSRIEAVGFVCFSRRALGY